MPLDHYLRPDPGIWSGRKSDQALYLHEKVECLNLEKEEIQRADKMRFALLGYACDEGVKRNQGRIGAAAGPGAIRKALGKMPNHLPEEALLLDVGTIACSDGDMEGAQIQLAGCVSSILERKTFPILLGGGHDMAYGHFNGIRNYLGPEQSIGIINFDAHFDLRPNTGGNNSGTPFYQIARDCEEAGTDFQYLCLGIRKDANHKQLYQTAKKLGVRYVEREAFSLSNSESLLAEVQQFTATVDHVYTTIDLDGFSSAYAPGVSAASPMGFSPDIVLKCLNTIMDSKKLIAIDLAEMNPAYDIEGRTAKLAASLAHSIMHRLA